MEPAFDKADKRSNYAEVTSKLNINKKKKKNKNIS